ncbi:hypothetical protein GCM10010313_29050 [Streptomyces violarus]|nr:hypothetical protein GCM10010313_29050 [Streptomyces violarus]
MARPQAPVSVTVFGECLADAFTDSARSTSDELALRALPGGGPANTAVASPGPRGGWDQSESVLTSIALEVPDLPRSACSLDVPVRSVTGGEHPSQGVRLD